MEQEGNERWTAGCCNSVLPVTRRYCSQRVTSSPKCAAGHDVVGSLLPVPFVSSGTLVDELPPLGSVLEPTRAPTDAPPSSEPDQREYARGTFVPVKDLSPHLRAALQKIGYGARDVEVRATRNVAVSSPSGRKGARGFSMALNLDNGQQLIRQGAWGGATFLDPRAVDVSDDRLDLPENGAVIKGTTGYPRTLATVYVHPTHLENLLPAAEEELLPEDHQALYAYGSIRAGQYRRDELRRRKVRDATVESLIERGYLSRTKAGAVQITTKGKNARSRPGAIRY